MRRCSPSPLTPGLGLDGHPLHLASSFPNLTCLLPLLVYSFIENCFSWVQGLLSCSPNLSTLKCLRKTLDTQKSCTCQTVPTAPTRDVSRPTKAWKEKWTKQLNGSKIYSNFSAMKGENALFKVHPPTHVMASAQHFDSTSWQPWSLPHHHLARPTPNSDNSSVRPGSAADSAGTQEYTACTTWRYPKPARILQKKAFKQLVVCLRRNCMWKTAIYVFSSSWWFV